jgi:hypothetical protein
MCSECHFYLNISKSIRFILISQASIRNIFSSDKYLVRYTEKHVDSNAIVNDVLFK